MTDSPSLADARHRPLTAADLLPQPLSRLGTRVLLHDTLDSTNALLLRSASELPDGCVAAAEFQTAGRGRLGRRWEAPRGASLLISVLLHEPADSPLLAWGSLLGSLAACEAIAAATDCPCSVRWPNDLVLQRRKVGGVLTESCPLPLTNDTGSRSARRGVVIGIGINCLQQRGHFSAELSPLATSIECESPRPVRRALLAAALLERLDFWLARLAGGTEGCGALRRSWRSHCEELGRRVTLQHDGRLFAGTLLDVSEDGDLIVELDEGGRRCFAAATTTHQW